jgi:hypothetical protein
LYMHLVVLLMGPCAYYFYTSGMALKFCNTKVTPHRVDLFGENPPFASPGHVMHVSLSPASALWETWYFPKQAGLAKCR